MKREVYYEYTKPATTVTKTIVHNTSYTDGTSITTSGKSLKRHKIANGVKSKALLKAEKYRNPSYKKAKLKRKNKKK